MRRAEQRALAGACLLFSSACSLGCGGSRAAASAVSEIDGFENLGAWTTEASDGVVAGVRTVAGESGQALALDFDFRGHAGYAGVRRALPIQLPPNYEIAFSLRGNAKPNDLQIKLSDASGENVWWYRLHDVVVSADWQRIRFVRRRLEFAWGTNHAPLAQAAALEIVVAAGSGGGSGTIEVDALSLRELPVAPAVSPALVASASSSAVGAVPALALDGRAATSWHSAPGAPAEQRFALDFGYAREFGGLVLRWAPGAEARRYDVELSDDGRTWQLGRRVTEGNGDRDALRLPDARARYLRLALHEGPGQGYGLAELEVKDLAFGASPNAFVSALAQAAPKGRYPRGFSGEQAYWTLVGVDGGHDSGLLSEDGALELGRGGPSIEPFVALGSELVSWADVEISHALRDGYLPIPSVLWHRPDWELRVTAFGCGDRAHVMLGARYELSNLTARPLALRLVLAVRPFQVNPPTQSLNLVGGVSPIHALAWDGSRLHVNDKSTLVPLTAPDAVRLSSFDAAEFPEHWPVELQGSNVRELQDGTGLASGLLVYELQVPPRGRVALEMAAPLGADGFVAAPGGHEPLRALEDEVAAGWHEQLNRVTLQVPAAGQALVDTLRSNLAYILLSRDGPLLRPGTRSYARSWIRDGAMMSEALLRLGQADVAAAYFDAYAPYQFESGKVPCCVDARGADPVPEHDSPGEFIFLAAEVFRFTHDRPRAERAWPHVAAAAEYLESLRQAQRAQDRAREGADGGVAGPPVWSGLLPPSISHEGYSDKPAYSYWDDFWALIGYQDASWLASVLGHEDARSRLVAERDEFKRDLYASLRASAAAHHVPFLPGAADRGDFDATSTTIALEPGREAEDLPHDLLLSTFERYWQDFEARRTGQAWDAYTPYELRVVGSFVRLGWRKRAEELFSFLLAGRRPAAWNQWAEVVGREARQPRFVGDMPHAWISSDLIRSVLDLFAYARESDQTLVLAAGLPAAWFDAPGVRIRELRTRYGRLDYSVTRNSNHVIFEVSGDAQPARFAIPWPWDGTPSSAAHASVDGASAHWEDAELRFARLPAHIVIEAPLLSARSKRGSSGAGQ